MFLDIVFPTDISYGSSGGASGWETETVLRQSGYEDRDERREDSLGEWEVAHGIKTKEQLLRLQAFHRVCRGKSRGFKFLDPLDFEVLSTEGFMGSSSAASGVGDGTPTRQLWKRYSEQGQTQDRIIQKPKSGTVIGYRGVATLVFGAGAGQIALDYATGIVTFVADASQAITGHTPGASHQFTTAANITQLSIGDKVYITGVTGTGATTLNGLAHTIANKTGTGPYTWTISTTTTGLTASGGTAFAYPQADEALTWEGQFYVPARFDVDKMRANLADYNVYGWNQIPVVEIRDIS